MDGEVGMADGRRRSSRNVGSKESAAKDTDFLEMLETDRREEITIRVGLDLGQYLEDEDEFDTRIVKRRYLVGDNCCGAIIDTEDGGSRVCLRSRGKVSVKSRVEDEADQRLLED